MVDTVVSKSLITRAPINTVTGQIAPINTDLTTMQGTVTLNGATDVTIANTGVTANSVIIFSFKTLGGTQGAQPKVTSLTAGTGFNVAGTASDTSIYNYRVLG